MQIQRLTGVAAYGLYHRGREIGRVNGRRIGFHGFLTREDAAAAAWAAAQEIELRRRAGPRPAPAPAHGPEVVVVEQEPGRYIVAHCQPVASLIPVPGEAPGDPDRWGFEIELGDDHGPDTVALGVARVMWRGIRARRLQLRMEQFTQALAE